MNMSWPLQLYNMCFLRARTPRTFSINLVSVKWFYNLFPQATKYVICLNYTVNSITSELPHLISGSPQTSSLHIGVLKIGNKRDVFESMRLCHCSQARLPDPRNMDFLFQLEAWVLQEHRQKCVWFIQTGN